MASGPLVPDLQTLLGSAEDQAAHSWGTMIRQLERLMQSPQHPYRQLAGYLEPVLTEKDSGVEAGQSALLLVFALLLARCGKGLTGPQFQDRFFSGRLAVDQPLLHNLLCQWRAVFDQAPAASHLIGHLISQLAANRSALSLDPRSTGGPGWHPLMRLFELLMASSHGTLRRQRGVYFTPQPIVARMVDRVDQVLRTELAEVDGLLSPSAELRIVDPACGAGAFLLQVIEHAQATFRRSESAADGKAFVSSLRTPRLVGIDVMPACCAAARLLLEFQLPTHRSTQTKPYLVHCQNSLTDIRLAESLFSGGLPIIFGNPPYANFGQLNQGDWIRQELRAYSSELKERKVNLSDDFIKFFRWGQYWIDRAGRGILALVTSNTYLTGLTHRQMRSSLSESFDRIEILDLHGDRKKRDRTGSGSPDGNVFGIQQGVAIGIFVKTGRSSARAEPSRISYAQLKGSRADKLRKLSHPGPLNGQPVTGQAPNVFFFPTCQDAEPQAYDRWPRVDEIFAHYISGVQTKRDALFVDFTAEAVAAKMRRFLQTASDGWFAPDIPSWLRHKAAKTSFDATCICPYMVAPWDVRWIYYDPRLLGRARQSLLGHFDPSNLALVFVRQTTNPGPYDNFMATNIRVSDRVFYSAHGAPFLAPLYVETRDKRELNLSSRFLEQLSSRINAAFMPAASFRQGSTFTARDLFHWLLATVHRSDYRRQHDSRLRIDFPRVPWPDSFSQFQQLASIGGRLTQIHLEMLDASSSGALSGSDKDELPAGIRLTSANWQPPNQLIVNSDHRLSIPVEPATWQFRMGGYQVLPRWLKQRRQRSLTVRDVSGLRRLIKGIQQTLELVRQIDRLA